MTLLSEIITYALRESNVVARAQTISSAEVAEALSRLQAILLSAVGDEVGYIMEDWNITDTVYTKPNGVPVLSSAMAAFTVKPNSRLICNLAGGTTLKLDPQPQDGQRFSIVDAGGNFATYSLTINPNGRKIAGATGNVAFSTNDTMKQWIYRSDLASWTLLDPLLSTDEMPFPQDFDDYFAILLAMRMNPRYGRKLDEQSLFRFKQQGEQFVNRYSQSRLRSIPAPAEANPARGGK